MTLSLRCSLALCTLGLILASCEGGAENAASSMMLPGSGTNALGAAPSTIVRIHVPSAGGLQPTTIRGNAVQSSIQMSGGAAGVFVTPTPMPLPMPGGGTGAVVTPPPAQAMTINIVGPTSLNQTIGLTPGANGCAASPGGTTCQAAFPLAPGTYTASISLYAASNASPATMIANAQNVAFAVTTAGNGIVNLTLAGTPAQLALVPASPTSVLNAQDGIDLYGAGKHQLVVELLDARQNVIIGGSLPNFTLNQAGGALGLSISQPPTGASNLFTINASPAPNGATATLRIAPNATSMTPNLCTNASTICNANVTVDVRQLLAVANTSANTVTLYAGQTTPMVTVQNGIIDPQALVFDGSGNLFVASQTGSVTEYTPPYVNPPTVISQGVIHPQALALDPHGNLFVANGSGSNTVTEYQPPYNTAPSVTITAGINDPVSIGLDGGSNLFVVNQAANTVTEYASPYKKPSATVTEGLSAPSSLAIDGHGNLFVANLNSTPNSVVEYTPPFSLSSTPAVTIANGVNEQGAIGLGGSASLFVPNQGANNVTEYVAPYTGTPTTITGGQNQPIALAVDSLANLFVANYGNNSVTEYASPYNSGSWTTISTGVQNPMALALSPPTPVSAAIVP